jgi:hypothetical protein
MCNLYSITTNQAAIIALFRVVNRRVEREFNPDRKDTHWGKRKLARDR